MKILIIEDEKPAAEHLERLLLKQAPHFRIVARLESVKQAVEWLKVPPTDYDLIFMDIKLADGLSFEIFKHVSVFKPII
ncbi:MAG: response regulator, partial [Bacteroidetes bacterium]|nr:response regulator [Bacteroidota bacterium]